MNEPTNQPSSLGVRIRLGWGKGVHVATASHFGGHLNFTRAADKQRYAVCSEWCIISCKCCEKLVMGALDIREEVERMFTAIGWRPYLNIFYPVFVELVREFYSTLNLTCLRGILSIPQM